MKTVTITGIMSDFLDSIRAYERESGSAITYDERDSSEFVNIFFGDGDFKIEEVKPKPLFVTEDGVEVFDGDKYIYICDLQIYTMEACKENAYLIGEIRFKHEENADKYIEENKPKPLFVTEDGVKIFDFELERCYYVNDKLEKTNSFINWFTVENLAKGIKVFKHESNADEYIWRNKPVFSYEDFIRWGNTPYPRAIEQLAKKRSEQ